MVQDRLAQFLNCNPKRVIEMEVESDVPSNQMMGEIHSMLQFLIERTLSLETWIEHIRDRQLDEIAEKRCISTSELMLEDIRASERTGSAERKRMSLLWDLDEKGLDFIMTIYADDERLKRFYHEKTKAERREERSRLRDEAKAKAARARSA